MGVDPNERLTAKVDKKVVNWVKNDYKEAPILSDDEEYRRGDRLGFN